VSSTRLSETSDEGLDGRISDADSKVRITAPSVREGETKDLEMGGGMEMSNAGGWGGAGKIRKTVNVTVSTTSRRPSFGAPGEGDRSFFRP
jgi:hypothetical protein